MTEKQIIYDGWLPAGVTAQQVHDAVLELESKYGIVTPQIILNEANPDSIWYKFIEWDDAKAAYQYRLEQIRRVLRNIKYRLESGDEVRVISNVTYIVENETVQGYFQTEKIISDPVKAKSLMRNAKADWEYFKSKYKALERLSKSFGYIDSAFIN